MTNETISFSLIKKALMTAGYNDMEPTADNLIECFLDYVDSGAWSNLDTEETRDEIESGEITLTDMVRALIKL